MKWKETEEIERQRETKSILLSQEKKMKTNIETNTSLLDAFIYMPLDMGKKSIFT